MIIVIRLIVLTFSFLPPRRNGIRHRSAIFRQLYIPEQSAAERTAHQRHVEDRQNPRGDILPDAHCNTRCRRRIHLHDGTVEPYAAPHGHHGEDVAVVVADRPVVVDAAAAGYDTGKGCHDAELRASPAVVDIARRDIAREPFGSGIDAGRDHLIPKTAIRHIVAASVETVDQQIRNNAQRPYAGAELVAVDPLAAPSATLGTHVAAADQSAVLLGGQHDYRVGLSGCAVGRDGFSGLPGHARRRVRLCRRRQPQHRKQCRQY